MCRSEWHPCNIPVRLLGLSAQNFPRKTRLAYASHADDRQESTVTQSLAQLRKLFFAAYEARELVSKKSCGVLSSLGPSVQWIQSYVTADKLYCIYHAADESLVRRHAELGGFPANKISPVTTVIDPATAE